MSTLSRRERRLLRAIERGLLDDDPELAQRLGGPGRAPEHDSVHQLTYVWSALALLLIFGGLSLRAMDMVLGGVTVLAALPLVIALVVLVNKTGR